MSRVLPFLLTALFIISAGCNSSERKNAEKESQSQYTSRKAPLDTADYEWQQYRNPRFHFALEYPDNWRVYESAKGEIPIINIYNFTSRRSGQLPLKIHEDPKISYIALFPKGYGTEAPEGDQMMLREAASEVPVSFAVDEEESVAWQLNDGQIWAFYLKPASPPPGWDKTGFIFVQIGVRGSEMKCFNSLGKEKPVQNCNTMGGTDRLVRYGAVKRDQRQQIDRMLSSLHFFNGNNERSVDDLVKVEQPEPGAEVTSPILVKGKARGMWFFEAEFPVVLRDNKNKEIATVSATAQAEWMTEDWVPFEAEISFDVSASEPATLVFKRSNPSGMPEHDRSHSIPLVLVPSAENN